MSKRTSKWVLILPALLVLMGAVLVVGRNRRTPQNTGQTTNVLLQGADEYGGDNSPLTLSWLPARSWKLTSDQDLIDAIADAARSAKLLPSPMGASDDELLYVRGSDGRAFTISYAVPPPGGGKRVILADGLRESKSLCRLLEQAKRKAGPVQEQPWPKDALTVPHNKW